MKPLGPLLLAVWMVGCASPVLRPGETPWTSGRISIRVDAEAGAAARSFSAGFEMRAEGDAGELRLNSPLGSRIATARWAPGQVVLIGPEGERRFESLEAMSREALGESLPLAALPDWIAGRPWQAAPHRVNEVGFEQLGWQVLLGSRASGQIEARRDEPPAVRLRVFLDEGSR